MPCNALVQLNVRETGYGPTTAFSLFSVLFLDPAPNHPLSVVRNVPETNSCHRAAEQRDSTSLSMVLTHYHLMMRLRENSQHNFALFSVGFLENGRAMPDESLPHSEPSMQRLKKPSRPGKHGGGSTSWLQVNEHLCPDNSTGACTRMRHGPT